MQYKTKYTLFFASIFEHFYFALKIIRKLFLRDKKCNLDLDFSEFMP